MFYEHIELKPHERATLYIDDEFQGALLAGKHKVFRLGKKVAYTRHNIENPYVSWIEKSKVLRFSREKIISAWDIVETSESQVAFVWHRHLPCVYIPPSQAEAFWKTEDTLNIHVQAIDDYWLPEAVQQQLFHLPSLPSNALVKLAVQADQRVLLIYKGQLTRILSEGEYVLYNAQKLLEVRAENLLDPRFAHPQLDTWRTTCPELVNERFIEQQTSEQEAILVYNRNELVDVVAPSHRASFWRSGLHELRFERITADVTNPIDEPLASVIKPVLAKKTTDVNSYVTMVVVPEHHLAVVQVDNKAQTPLSAGVYFYWQFYQTLQHHLVDLRSQTVEVTGQEILTKDKVNLRLNVTCNYSIIDALVWLGNHEAPKEHLYREIQFAIRSAIGSHDLDSLLNDKNAIDGQIAQNLNLKAIQGIRVDSIGIKDIILPGEMRAILTQVVEAEKIAQANNIRRREETAATRSLLNTARVMEENPTALRLKELETLERVTEKIDKISVFGGLDGLLNGLINIKT